MILYASFAQIGYSAVSEAMSCESGQKVFSDFVRSNSQFAQLSDEEIERAGKILGLKFFSGEHKGASRARAYREGRELIREAFMRLQSALVELVPSEQSNVTRLHAA